ncbi:serine/threonine-protein kinase [Pseudomarimonas arenosa]|uniref:Serine/threonine protein kinase n=1 Tax=Pseudomarimonas arenosa TaxID=2774145 RepID=A0AAW3ZNH8_9GAMM|nr:serine/threonine-protein kinase [Pseudomarimonas arenosa]MBD8525846.1 serine/threonine protein kinase [Pseudomarimonas arenosa]
MQIETERHALRLFRQLLDLDHEAEPAFWAELERQPSAVAARVRSLLRGHANATDRLGRMVTDDVESAPRPAQLGRFRLLRDLGRGGMGQVAEAECDHQDFQQRVALKWVREAQLDAAARERFQFERHVLAQLSHPHIAQLIDGGRSADGVLWYAMELVQGQDLLSHCQSAALDLRHRVKLLVELCEAVAHAHRHSILHRDIKPGNVLVTAEGKLKLIDFGIAKALDFDSGLTVDSAPMTPRYAAPEQRAGERPTTGTDLWQIGALAHELLTGRPPQVHDDGEAQRASDTLDPSESADDGRLPLPAKALRRALQGDLDAILRRALRRQPDDRYASADALRADLADWLAGRAIALRRHERWYLLRRFARRHHWALGFAALAILGLVGGGTLALLFAQRASQQAEIAERSSALLSEMFVGNYNAPNLASMTLGEFFSHAIDTAIADQQLPAEHRYELLYDLYPRALEMRAFAAAERAARELLVLGPQAGGALSLHSAIAHDMVAGVLPFSRGYAAIAEIEQHVDAAERIYQQLGLTDNPEYGTTHLRVRLRLAELRGDAPQLIALARQGQNDGRHLRIGLRLNMRPWLVRGLLLDGQYAAAAAAAKQLLADAEAAAIDTPSLNNMLDWLRSLHCEAQAQAAPAAALGTCQALLDRLQAEGRWQTRNALDALTAIASAEAALGRHQLALANLDRADALRNVIEGTASTSRERQLAKAARARSLLVVGEASAATALFEDALQQLLLHLPEHHPQALRLRIELIEALLQSADHNKALLWMHERLETEHLAPDWRRRWQRIVKQLAARRPRPDA